MTNPVTSYLYDVYGDMKQVTDANGHVTLYTFDQFGHELSRQLPMTQTETASYDPDGRLSTSVDFDGQKTVYHYNDALGVVDTKTFYAAGLTTPGETIVYHFDVLGHNDVVTDTQGANQRVTLYGYNSENRLSSITSPEGWLQYGYDPATGEHASTTTQNTDTRYGYDALGRLWTVTVDMLNGASLATPLVTTYHYTALSNVSEIDYPNGAQTSYSYDLASGTHLLGVVNAEGSTLLSSYTYTINADGLWRSDSEQERESNGSYSSRVFTWTYDALNRLTQESLSSSIAGESYTTSYTLDLVGNRVGETTTNNAETLVVADTYNANDDLTQESGTLNAAASYQTNYGYDGNGSQTSVTRTGTSSESDTYTYDLRGNMASAAITRQENGQTVVVSASYQYDNAGTRVAQSSTTTIGDTAPNTETEQDIIDENNPSQFAQILETHISGAGAPVTTYILGRHVIGQLGSAGIVYVLTDGHASTRQVATANGTVVAAYVYDAFGAILNQVVGIRTPAITPILYSGQYYDLDLARYYLRARYYAPLSGRFLAMDSYVGDPQDPRSFTEYVYANADPVNGFDPSGHFDSGVAAALVGMAVGAVFVALQGSSGGAGARAAAGPNLTPTVTEAAHMVAAGPGELSRRGEMKVRWAPQRVTRGGFVIQHSKVYREYRTAPGGPLIKETLVDFWEAWEVDAHGVVYIGYKRDGRVHRADTFSWDIPVDVPSSGFYELVGYARYREDFPVTWPVGGVPEALSLPSTRSEPPGWTDHGAFKHGFKMTWNDFRGEPAKISESWP